jgi:hypothetical protein
MRIFKSNKSTNIHQSLEREIGQNIQNLRRTNATFRHPEDSNDEMSANNLGARFRRLMEVSTREIESLIEQLQELRKKVHSDGDLIQNYFARYEGLSQGVMQLTAIISNNVKRLSPARDIGHETDSPSLAVEEVTPCPEAVSRSPSLVVEEATPCPEAVSLDSGI